MEAGIRMERKIGFIVVFLIVIMTLTTPFIAGAAASPPSSLRERIYKAYVEGKMDAWRGIIDQMEASSKEDHARLLELVNYQYGYIGFAIAKGQKEAATRYLAQAEKNLALLEKAKYQPSMTHAYRAAFYGFRIGLNPSSAPLNGLRSLRASSLAVGNDAANWFALVQKAHIQFYMPPAFGGSKKEALEYLLKARQLMEKNDRLTQGNWNYLSLLTLILQTYEALGDLPSAQHYCKLLLTREPDYSWVRDGLCPAIEEKINSQKE